LKIVLGVPIEIPMRYFGDSKIQFSFVVISFDVLVVIKKKNIMISFEHESKLK